MIAEVNRDRKKRHKPYQACDFMPPAFAAKAKAAAAKGRRSRGIPITADTIHNLKAFLPKGKR